MLQKKILLVSSLVVLLTSCQAENDVVNDLKKDEVVRKDNIYGTNYDVQIDIVDNNGNLVTSHDLGDFYARNQETGEYFYSDNPYREYVDIIEELPEGTYLFGVRDGYFDGASSVVMEVNENTVNDEGIVEVDLVYWSE